MRYKENNEIHKDFHGATLMSANYIVANYGIEALQKIMHEVGTKVYMQINNKLKDGDTSELIEYKEYFLEREGGEFEMVKHDNGLFDLTVSKCPMMEHLKKLGMEINDNFYLLNRFLNEALCDGTPYELSYEKLDNGVTRECLTFKKGGQ